MDKVEPGTVKVKKARHHRTKGLFIRTSSGGPVVAQEVLDKHLAQSNKPSDEEIDMLWESVNSKEVWERTPGVYALAVGTYFYNRSKAKAANSVKPARAE